MAGRPREYIASIKIGDDHNVFPIGYTSAREIVQPAGKIILRHANLSTTQRYLGKVSDTEAIHWIDNLYG